MNRIIDSSAERCLHRLGIVLFLLLFCPVYTLSAQETTDSLSVILEPVTVEAAHSSITLDKASISVSTLQRSIDDLTFRRASTLDELTFHLPGVWISNRENHALGERMTVRGMGWRSPFGVRGIQIILDDIPLTVADGQTILNMVDPAMITSLELLRGPSATFWGNSSGGVLYMRTRPPADFPNVMLRSYIGSFGTMKHEGRWYGNPGGVRIQAYGSYYETEGYRDHSSAKLLRGGLSAGFDLGEHSSLETRVAYSGMPEAEHPGSLPDSEARQNPRMAWPAFADARAGKDFQQWMTSGRFLHSFNSGILTFSAHGIHRELNNPLLPSVGFIEVDRLAGGLRSTYDFQNLPFELVAGAEIKAQRDDRSQRNNINGTPGDIFTIRQLDNVRNQALFAKAGLTRGRITISLGLRGDRMEFRSDSIDVVTDNLITEGEDQRIFTTLNPSFGVNLNLHNARLYTNFSTSFESPTTTEFKNRPGGGTGFNPQLDPERTVGIETGIRGLSTGLNLEYDVAVFGLNVDGLIIPFEEEDGGPTLFRNEGSTRHYGLESHIRWTFNSGFSIDLMYTWIDASFNEGEFSGNRVPGVTPHRVASTVSLPLANHIFSTDAEYVGRFYTDSANTSSNSSYMLFNSRWTYHGFVYDGWRIQPFISVHNLLDTRYNTSVSINAFGGRFFEPGSGRSIQGGLSLQF